jgi:hypothetical protein
LLRLASVQFRLLKMHLRSNIWEWKHPYVFRKAGDVIEPVIAWDVLQISARRLLSKKDFKEHQTIIKPYRAPPNSILGPHERSKPHMKLPFEGGNVTAVLPTSCHYSMQKGCSLWQSQAPQLLSYSYQRIRKVHGHQPDIFHSSFWACWACNSPHRSYKYFEYMSIIFQQSKDYKNALYSYYCYCMLLSFQRNYKLFFLHGTAADKLSVWQRFEVYSME